LGYLNIDLLQPDQRLNLNIHAVPAV
jgi:hypothetical protein